MVLLHCYLATLGLAQEINQKEGKKKRKKNSMRAGPYLNYCDSCRRLDSYSVHSRSTQILIEERENVRGREGGKREGRKNKGIRD